MTTPQNLSTALETEHPSTNPDGSLAPFELPPAVHELGHVFDDAPPKLIGVLRRKCCEVCGAAVVLAADGRSWGAACEETCPIDWAAGGESE